MSGYLSNYERKYDFLQDEFINDDDILLLSHTVTPEIDSVPILKNIHKNKGL